MQTARGILTKVPSGRIPVESSDLQTLHGVHPKTMHLIVCWYQMCTWISTQIANARLCECTVNLSIANLRASCLIFLSAWRVYCWRVSLVRLVPFLCRVRFADQASN